MAIVGKAVVVFNDAVLVGLLNNHASHTALLQFFLHGGARCGAVFGRNHLYLHTLEVRIGAYYGQNLIVDGFGNQHLIGLLARCNGHDGGFGSGSASIIHRGIGDGQAGKFGHHALKLEDVVQRAL